MIPKKTANTSVPMSFFTGHLNVQFNFLRSVIGACEVKMH